MCALRMFFKCVVDQICNCLISIPTAWFGWWVDDIPRFAKKNPFLCRRVDNFALVCLDDCFHFSVICVAGLAFGDHIVRVLEVVFQKCKILL